MTIAYLGLGSNVGDRKAHLAEARRRIDEAGAHILRASSVIETEPWGITEQARFLNQVLEVEWPRSARDLLAAMKNVLQQGGRTPTYRWGPREIDVDILLFGDQRIDEPDLQVPHPRMWERDFVMRPLGELRPDILKKR
jgi:2-amino-4-hydroxy-6-hydroxymethyldihydropteridine diphosphokinase